jgi:antitoxin YefM
MAIETTYSHLRQNLASVLDRVVEDRVTVIIRRKKSEDVALIPAAELAGLMETAHLLRSPKNAKRLLGALARARRGQGRVITVAKLRKDLGLGAGRP